MTETKYKTNIDCSLIRGMVENYCTLCETQPWPTIHLDPRLRASVNSIQILTAHEGNLICKITPPGDWRPWATIFPETKSREI